MIEPALLQAIAAIASSVAALAALYVTFHAPKAAARYAEKLRNENDRYNEIKRQKEEILREILLARRGNVTRRYVIALNLIDIVFADSRAVRDRWAELYGLYNRNPTPADEIIEEKTNALLKAICEDLGISDILSPADLQRFYYPRALMSEDEAEWARRQLIVRDLEKASQPVTNESIFPPRPDTDSS